MDDDQDSVFDPGSFSGRVRVFPLPNVVLFPHAVLPLHIFEPRYRELMRAALDSDQQITLALLSSGWESHYEGRPPVEPVACLGRVTTHQRLADGRYNLLLEGLCRVRLVEELPPERSFREFRAELLADCAPEAAAGQRGELADRLRAKFQEVLSSLPQVQEPLGKVLGAGLPLGPLTDVITFMLDLGLQFKQELLSEPDVDERARRLLSRLGDSGRRWQYPPRFSAN